MVYLTTKTFQKSTKYRVLFPTKIMKVLKTLGLCVQIWSPYEKRIGLEYGCVHDARSLNT